MQVAQAPRCSPENERANQADEEAPQHSISVISNKSIGLENVESSQTEEVGHFEAAKGAPDEDKFEFSDTERRKQTHRLNHPEEMNLGSELSIDTLPDDRRDMSLAIKSNLLSRISAAQ